MVQWGKLLLPLAAGEVWTEGKKHQYRKESKIFRMKIIEVLCPSQSYHKLLPEQSYLGWFTCPSAGTLFSNLSHHLGYCLWGLEGKILRAQPCSWRLSWTALTPSSLQKRERIPTILKRWYSGGVGFQKVPGNWMGLLGCLKVRRRLGRGELTASGSFEKLLLCALLGLFWSSKYFSRYFTMKGSCQLFAMPCHAMPHLPWQSSVQHRASKRCGSAECSCHCWAAEQL